MIIEELQIVEYNNQRVLLTNQLAESYGTDTKSISYNFNHNKERYQEGKHYYLIQGDELRAFREIHGLPKNLNKVYLWTERGAFLHAKSLNTDKAWEVYDSLVEYYFNSREAKPKALPMTYKEALIQLIEQVEENEKLELQNRIKTQQICEMKPKVDYCDLILKSDRLVTISQIAKDYGKSSKAFNKILNELKVQYKQSGQWLLYSKFQDKGYTQSETILIKRNDGRSDAKLNTKWTQKGRLFLYNLLKENNILPMIEQVN